MRLMRIAIGVMSVAIAVAIFLYVSDPRRDLDKLRPYITRQDCSYSMQNNPGMPPHPTMFQDVGVRGLTLREARALIKDKPNQSHGFLFLTTERGVGIGSSFPSDHLEGIAYWKQLSWNEQLWVRLTHLGKNPFINWQK